MSAPTRENRSGSGEDMERRDWSERIDAVVIAIWCAASASVPMRPISNAAAANTPNSSSMVPEIGAPITISRPNSDQSGRQK